MYSHITYEKVPLATYGFIGLSTIVLASMIFRDTKQEPEPKPEQTLPQEEKQTEEQYEETEEEQPSAEEEQVQQTAGGKKRKTKRQYAKHNRKTKRR